MSSPARLKPAKPAKLSIQVRGRARKIIKKWIVADISKHLRRVMHAAGVADRALSLSLVDDDEMLALNKTYAGEDHATDVLSFEQEAPLLGDIVISVETARSQADRRCIDLVDELIYLAIHGMAHLQGLDHRTKREEKVMFAYVDRLSSEAYGYGRPPRIPLPKVSSRRRRRA